MNKKGNMGMISSILILLIALAIITTFAIPIIKNNTESQSYTESLIKINASNEENKTLTYTDMETGSFSISGLTATNNYTIDYTTGVVTFVAGSSLNDTYTASYNYYEDTYQTSAGNRAVFGLLILVLIFGLVYLAGSMFGLF